jgi:RecA/RadA recombinase
MAAKKLKLKLKQPNAPVETGPEVAKSNKRMTVGEKKRQRDANMAAAPKTVSYDRISGVIDSINKRLAGGGRVFRASEYGRSDKRRRSSGVPSVDYVTGGGYPVGGCVEIGGEFSSGKTSLAIEALAVLQRTTREACAWVAIEPFSKRWARERGFFLPFSEQLVLDPQTGKKVPLDPFADASELELHRMQEAGITDPYKEVSPFVLVQESRGDVALDAALDLLKSNMFAYVVVDSFGIAKSTKWLEENEVQDAQDFAREPKMINDYTARCNLIMNYRYDGAGNRSKDGLHTNDTTMIHLNQIVTVIGTTARAKYKTQSIKGGEGNKHNHHIILFIYKGEYDQIEDSRGKAFTFAQETRVKCLKNKLSAPLREGTYKMFLADYGANRMGDIDYASDLLQYALMSGTVTRAGSNYRLTFKGVRKDLTETKWNGKEKFAEFLKGNQDVLFALWAATLEALRS